ncbi:hypothetical protein BJ875DRAFT_449881 [Amylocarpus encephaloides]|uniref:Homeobox domain-containing protein n=1 Tax=Amylocarpus encephaloides TaxID=45428 RepID=A0A9P8C9F3_9HELO|nr:hypothetical protein BJ875DRAFT_449881 [Amylocarpus encephaloides]
MTDATYTPPCSSLESITKDRQRAGTSQDVEGSDANGEHVASSITSEGEVGDAETENTKHSKQRRKRTRPQDQAVLEAEYRRNPKPNKAARAEIVERVSLNEKEVQIWFQNRRQINRRKSRPLLPHEIAAFGLGGMAAMSSDPLSSSSQEDEEDSTNFTQETMSSQEQLGSSQGTCVIEAGITEEGAGSDNLEVQEPMVDDVEPTLPSHDTKKSIESSDRIQEDPCSSESTLKSSSDGPGYLANRWSYSFSTPSSTQAPIFTAPPITKSTQALPCPERIEGSQSTPSSQVRLSMSLDGKAELIPEASPSPPRATPPRPSSSRSFMPQTKRTLQRSQSALPFTFPVEGPASNTLQFPSGRTSGRSRDARSWEFCCDPEARDELTAQAENESNGSAVAAISLLRSTSNSALKPNSNKRNAPSTKNNSSTLGKKPKLGRATSSLARLQTPHQTTKLSKDKAVNPKDNLMRSPSGDSDKENWFPSENGFNPRRRPLPSGKTTNQPTSRAVLGDNLDILSHAVNFGGSGKRRRKAKEAPTEIFEDQGNAENASEDVEKFMRGEVSPSKKGDLDCIQGLLSLSQGNWR